MLNTKSFDTNAFFSGGAGIFLQYYDVIRPIYLYALFTMIVNDYTLGLPFHIIQNMSVLSLLEWYKNRHYVNPLKQLDFNNQASEEQLDDTLEKVITTDKSLYNLAPVLSIARLINVYHQQHMSFPFFIYSEKENPFIKKDCDDLFLDIPHHYVYGDLETALKKCDHNFSYIFSNIELLKMAIPNLSGKFANVLLSQDYRYNFKDYFRTPKYNMQELVNDVPLVRLGFTQSIVVPDLLKGMQNIKQGGEK